MEVNVKEAAEILGITTKEVRHRLHTGELPGIKESSAQNAPWIVVLPDDLEVATAKVEVPLTKGSPVGSLAVGEKFVYNSTLWRKMATIEGEVRAYRLVEEQGAMTEDSITRLCLGKDTLVEKK